MDYSTTIPIIGMLIPIVAILGAFLFVIVRTVMNSRIRELEIRQRIALIERGLVPPPEVDPRGFEQTLTRLEVPRTTVAAARHRRAGIILLGLGFGLMLLISIAGENPEDGLGVGGFLVAVGVAFLANSWFEVRSPAASAPSTPGSTPPTSPPVRHDAQ